ncbi:pentapeptide repeat-containing protein [Desulfovibrio sp. UCD-KL4C]|uniref:pentapeptide repeat-containing protein n=1 Tax=Desulfovibrio sp. UCD-KL4C TaxID=2578120 RepID=UPI0025C6A2A0|nr:pentapeptide repeat-containing protein [Desulfovibrio sp. UCD-KL4C]
MACYVGAEHNNWCKDYDIVYVDDEGKEYCIFHAPAEHKYSERYVEGEGPRPELISGDDFNALVFARIQAVIDAGEDEERDRYKYSNWNPRCNLAGTIFFTDISFSKFNEENGTYLPPINFFKTQFRGGADFHGTQFRGWANFNGTQFRGVAVFYDSQFRGMANFQGTQFRGLTYFQRTQFRGWANFNGTQFREMTDFQRTQFRGVASFQRTQFRGVAYFQGTQFRGEANFQITQFRGEANFQRTQFRGVAYFQRTQFRGVAYFYDSQFRGVAYFYDSQFRGGAYFYDSQFRGVAYFYDSQFRGGAYFQITQFRGLADFQRTQFRGLTYFQRTQFRGWANFNGTQFREMTDFQRTQFRGVASFQETCFAGANFINAESRKKIIFNDSTFGTVHFDSMNFQKYAIFTGAWFLEETSFTETIFHEYSNFEGTEFYGKTSFKHALFKEWTYFRNVVFNMNTSFAGTISKETILIENSELSKLLFTETNIESFKFIECTWPELKGRKVIYDERLNLKKENNFLKLEEIYRRLKKISRDNNDEILASAWHYKEKEMLRKRLHYENKLTSLRTLFLRAINNIYWAISGYGEEPLQAFAFLFLFILCPLLTAFYFGPFYEFTLCGDIFKDNTHLVSRWLWYLPLTKIKLTCANISDWNYFFKVFYNLLVTIQAALFAFALRNKLRR